MTKKKAQVQRRATHTDLSGRIDIRTENALFDIVGGLSEPALILILDSVQDRPWNVHDIDRSSPRANKDHLREP